MAVFDRLTLTGNRDRGHLELKPMAEPSSDNPGGIYLGTDGAIHVHDGQGFNQVARTGAIPSTVGARRLRVQQMIATFATGHGWANFSGIGTMSTDTSVVSIGTGSLKIINDSSGTSILRKTGLAAIDMSTSDLVMWLRVDDPSKLSFVDLYISSDTFTNYAALPVMNAAARPYAVADEWVALTIPKDRLAVTGSPNFSAITSLQLRVRATTDNTVTVWFGGIGLIPAQSEGVVSVTFDDGYDDHYNDALPILSKYGIPATTYVICDTIGNSGKVTLDQLRELHDVHGWEVALHSYANDVHTAKYDTLTAAEVETDFIRGKQWLIENGFADGADHLCYPGGGYNATVLQLARKYFRSARSISEDLQELPPHSDLHRLRSYSMVNTRSAATVQGEIDKAIADKSWLILVMHQIVGPGEDDISTEYPTDDLDTVMAYLRSSGVTVKTVGDVISGR